MRSLRPFGPVIVRGQSLDRSLHHRNPFTWDFVIVAVIVERYDILLQNSIQRLRIARVNLWNVFGVDAVSYGKTIGTVISFQPPAIEY